MAGHSLCTIGSTKVLHVSISHPFSLFPLDMRARKHLLIAGGIGITPIMAMAYPAPTSRQAVPIFTNRHARPPPAPT